MLEAYSVSHGKASAWLPVLELLRDYFDIQDADDAARAVRRCTAGLTGLDAALEDTLPYLFVLLGIPETADPLAQMDRADQDVSERSTRSNVSSWQRA